jgi:hypothetical protein
MDLVTELLQCREYNYTLLERAADEIARRRDETKWLCDTLAKLLQERAALAKGEVGNGRS